MERRDAARRRAGSKSARDVSGDERALPLQFAREGLPMLRQEAQERLRAKGKGVEGSSRSRTESTHLVTVIFSRPLVLVDASRALLEAVG